MDERGYGSAIASAIVVLVLLISISIITGVLENTYDKTRASQNVNSQQNVNASQTDIKIENAIYHPPPENYLEITTKNTGSTVLSVSKTNLIVNGNLLAEENIEKRTISEDENTNIWIPKENFTLTTENIFPEEPSRVKVVVEYGISDYTENITSG